MKRRWILTATAAVAIVLGAATLVPLRPGIAALRVQDGQVREVRVGPALLVRDPFRTRIVRLPLAPLSIDEGQGRRVIARPDPAGPPDALLRLAADPAAALQEAVDRARAAGGDMPAALDRELRAGGFLPETIEWAGAELPRVDAAGDTGLDVLLVGIDSADWDRIEPRVAAGELPNLARLRRTGAWGTLLSDSPSLSPLLWTTAATGRTPDEHGIIDFVMLDPTTGAQVPISSRFRRVKAFWNILSDAGLSVDVVDWWASWPAEPVEGVLVSDRVAYSLFRYQEGADLRGLTYPESYATTAGGLKVEPWEVTLDEVRELADVSSKEFQASTERLRAGAPTSGFEDHLDSLRRTLASTRTYHRIALDLLSRSQPRLMAVYYQGLDEVNHRFAHFSPPAHPLANAEDRRRYGRTVDAFYTLQDRLLGELLDAVKDGTTVMVLSDHGFANGAERPLDFAPYIEAGRPGRWHTPEGIFLLAGPPVQPGHLRDPVRLLQITPTLLRLLGLPLAQDQPGAPIEEALTASFRDAHPESHVPTYETGPRETPAEAAGASAVDDAMLARLRALGYLSGQDEGGEAAAGGGETTANYHANLGVVKLGQGDLAAAAAAFRAALERNPNHVSARGGLIQIDMMQGRKAEALEGALRLIQETRGFDPVFYYITAQLFAQNDRSEEGLALFRRLVEERGDVAQIHTGLGILHQDAGDREAALQDYRRALDLRPESLYALQELFSLEMPRGDLPDLLRRTGRAIDRAPAQVMPYNWRGLVLRQLGRNADAEAAFREALRRDPDSVRTLVNLSSLLVDGGRSEEAIPLLRRALEAQPQGIEPRINLIVALGRTGRLQEARREFDAAGGEEKATPDLLNAMAFASFLNDAPGQARELLQRSLSLDPEQPEARRLLAQVAGG